MTTPTNSAFERLVEQLGRLPGIGRRSAQRIAFHLLRRPADEAEQLAAAIRAFRSDLKACGVCGNVSESDPCPICADAKRDAGLVMVVEQPSDVASIEQLGNFRGVYHVLMGRVAPLEGIGPGELNVAALLERVEQGGVREVILGTNPTLEGDGTAMFLAQQLQRKGITVTRLARGLPAGSSLDRVSKAALSDALQGRQGMS